MTDLALEKFQQARMDLMFNHPFFSTLLMTQRPVRDAPGLDTMAVDGKHLFWSTKFVNECSREEVVGVLAHEVLHLVFFHHLRRGPRHPKLWNIACVSEDTSITMADGSHRAIQDILPGEYVASPFGPNRVLALTNNGFKETVEVSCGTSLVRATWDHLFATTEGFLDALSFRNSTANGFFVEECSSEGVCAGQFYSPIAQGVERTHGGSVWDYSGVSSTTRTLREQILLEATQSHPGSLLIRSRDGLLSWFGGRGGNGQRADFPQGARSTVSECREHLSTFTHLVNQSGVFGLREDQHSRSEVLSLRDEWVADRARNQAAASVARDQEAARARFIAHYGSEETAVLSCVTSGARRGLGCTHSGVQSARLSVREGSNEPRKVYDLSTEFGVVFTNGILTHNCDAVINNTLREAGFKLPEGGVDMPQYKGWTTEAVYDELAKMLRERGRSPDDEPGEGEGQDWGEVLDAPADSPAEKAEMEGNLKVAIQQAAMVERQKHKGNAPGYIDALVEQAAAVKLDWRKVLRDYVANTIKSDFSWSTPNRRYIHQDIYLPGRTRSGVGRILVYRDTSGSVGPNEHAQFMAEMQSIMEDTQPEQLVLIDCDTRVAAARFFDADEPLPRNIPGGGGSDFRPAFAYVDEHDIRPVVAVVLSDMMIDFPADAPPYPVIGVSTTDHRGPEWMNQQLKLDVG